MIKAQHEPKQNVSTYKVGRFVIQYCGILHRRSSSETSSIHLSDGKRSNSSSEDPVQIQKTLSIAGTNSNCTTPSSSNSQTPVRYVSLSSLTGIMAKSSSLNPMRSGNNDNNNNQTSTSLTTAELLQYSKIPDNNRSKSVCLFENKSSTPQPVYNPEFFSSLRVESVPEENEPPQIINSINEKDLQQQQQQMFQADELLIQPTLIPNVENDNNNNNNVVLEPPLLPTPASIEKQPLLINPIVFEEIPVVPSPDNQLAQQQPRSFDTSTFYTEPEMIIENDNIHQSKSMISPEKYNNVEQPIQPIQPIQRFINEQSYAPPTPPSTPPQYPITLVNQQQIPQQEEQHQQFIQTPPPPADLIEKELLLLQQEQQQQQSQQQLIQDNNNANTISPLPNPRIEILQRSSSNHSTDSSDSPFATVKELGTPFATPCQIWDDLPKERQIELLYELIDTVNTDGKIYDIMFPQTSDDLKRRTRNSLLNELTELTKKHELLQNQYNQLKNIQNKNVPV